MILHAIGGLCNRLRAILSYRAAHSDAIDVVWDADEYVSHASWADVFEPLQGVRFVSGRWDEEAYAPCWRAPRGWDYAYRSLRPIRSVQERIDRCIAGLGGDYSAIHARRTDHAPNAALSGLVLESNDAFLSWAQESPRPLFVATDNGETADWFSSRYTRPVHVSARLGGAASRELTDHHRNGSLADAVVDLYVCAGATRFRGTVGSSFTDTIEILRRIRG